MITDLSDQTEVKHPCHLVISINDTTDQLFSSSVSDTLYQKERNLICLKVISPYSIRVESCKSLKSCLII